MVTSVLLGMQPLVYKYEQNVSQCVSQMRSFFQGIEPAGEGTVCSLAALLSLLPSVKIPRSNMFQPSLYAPGITCPFCPFISRTTFYGAGYLMCIKLCRQIQAITKPTALLHRTQQALKPVSKNAERFFNNTFPLEIRCKIVGWDGRHHPCSKDKCSIHKDELWGVLGIIRHLGGSWETDYSPVDAIFEVTSYLAIWWRYIGTTFHPNKPLFCVS